MQADGKPGDKLDLDSGNMKGSKEKKSKKKVWPVRICCMSFRKTDCKKYLNFSFSHVLHECMNTCV